MELGDASNEEAPPPCPRKREMSKYLCLQMISMLQSMQGNGGLWRGQSPSLPKDSVWHAAEYIDYESGQHACMPWVILFLQKLIPEKNSRRPPIYLKEFIQQSVKNLPLQKRHTQRKLAMSMGCQRQLCIIGLLLQTFMFIVTH